MARAGHPVRRQRSERRSPSASIIHGSFRIVCCRGIQTALISGGLVFVGAFSRRTRMINFILWLIFGGIAGWIASLIMGTDAQQGLLMNIIVGIIGAFIGGFLASLLVFGGNYKSFFSIG